MTYFIKPRLLRPDTPRNSLGYTRRDYEGAISTLCAGCGHDSISAAVVQACFDLEIEPHRVAKLSGIGCSSKTPDYFLGNSHGFNTTHGRMPSVLTGAALANRDLLYLGVSGDGDSPAVGHPRRGWHGGGGSILPAGGSRQDFITVRLQHAGKERQAGGGVVGDENAGRSHAAGIWATRRWMVFMS